MNHLRSVTDDTPNGAPLSNNQTLRVLGFLLIYGALVPPVAVILWRVATGAW